MNRSQKSLIAYSSIPLVGYGVLVLFAVYAFYSMGHWPMPNNPDPKQLDFRVIYSVVVVIVLVSLLSVPVLFFALVAYVCVKVNGWKPFDRLALALSALVFSLGVENKHRQRLRAAFPDYMKLVDTYVLDIEDRYRFMDEELIRELKSAIDPILEAYE